MRNLLSLTLAILLTAACGDGNKEPIFSTDGTLGEVSDTLDTSNVEEIDARADATSREDLALQDLLSDTQPEVIDVMEVPDSLVPDETQPDLVDIIEDIPLDIPQEDNQQPDLEPDLPPVDIVTKETCREILQCGLGAGCAFDSPDCWASCMAGGSYKALGEMQGAFDCFDAHCVNLPTEDQETCIWDTCGIDLLTCIGGDGTEDCATTMTCAETCNPDDVFCQWDCIAQADEDAITLLVTAMAGTGDESFVALVECIGGQGEGDCAETLLCMDGCNETDFSCTMDCITNASPDAATQLLDAMTCEGDACMLGLVECMGGGGEETCGQAFTCILGCTGMTSESCLFSCVGDTSPEGAANLVAFFECAINTCGNLDGWCDEIVNCFPECPDMPIEPGS